MRVILFRGKLKSGGNWMFGCLLVYGSRCFIIPSEELIESEVESRFYWHLLENNYEVLPEAVGQYTGMNDKNGQRIFEGDIIEVSHDAYHGARGVVFFRNGSFMLKKVSDVLSLYGFLPWCEVIGNIHDNPELMGEG